MWQTKVKILSTRPIEETQLDRAAQQHISIEVESFIKTKTAIAPGLQTQITALASEAASVIFTSVAAVEAVISVLGERKPDWKIFCIGHATRDACAKYFGEEKIAGIANNGTALARRVLDNHVERATFFCGNLRREELIGVVSKNGVVLDEMPVYETILLPHSLTTDYDGILFFSPSAVYSFFQNNKPGTGTIFFSIGNTTAEAIRRYAANKIVVSDEPREATLIEKVIVYFKMNIERG